MFPTFFRNFKIMKPYIGLRPFRRVENHLFFGRDAQTERLKKKLERKHFIAVTGVSGSGKSSLIYAGLIPDLIKGDNQSGIYWRTAITRPKNQPFENLAIDLLDDRAIKEEILKLFGNGFTESEITNFLTNDLKLSSGGLQELFTSKGVSINLPQGTNLLLIVDQFEELFRFDKFNDESSEEITKFIDFLLESKKHPNIYIIITIRSEFIGYCGFFYELSEAINEGLFVIPRLNYNQIEEAIEKPIKVCGGEIERPLVTLLLSDVEENRDYLPLMQHILAYMWDRSEKKGKESIELTLADYEELGGLQNALSVHADTIYKAFSEVEQEITEVIFRCLIKVEEDNPTTRCPTKLKEIINLIYERERDKYNFGYSTVRTEVLKIINYFRAEPLQFLSPHKGNELTDESIVDITHECLIRQWNKLKEWIEKEKEFVNQYKRLEHSALLYEDNQRDLLSDIDINIAKKWITEENPTPIRMNRYSKYFSITMNFINISYIENEKRKLQEKEREAKEKELLIQENSLSRRQTEIAKQELQNQTIKRELAERDKKIAEENNRVAKEREKLQKRRAKYKSFGISVLIFILASIIYILLVHQNIKQERSSDLFDSRIIQSALLAKNEDFLEAKEILNSNKELIDEVPIPFHQFFKRIFSNSENIYDIQTYNFLQRFENIVSNTTPEKIYDIDSAVYSIAVKDNLLAIGGNEGTLAVLDINNGETLKKFIGHGGNDVNGIVFHPRKPWIISAGNDKRLIIYSFDGTELYKAEVKQIDSEITALAIHPKKPLLATGDKKGNIILWKIALNEAKLDFNILLENVHRDRISNDGLAFSENGLLLGSASEDGKICLWDMKSKELIGLFSETEKIQGINFSPDNKTLITYGKEKTIRLWDIQQVHHISKLHSLSSWRWDGYLEAILDDDSKQINVSEKVINFSQENSNSFFGHKDKIFSANFITTHFISDETYIISGGADSDLRLWDIESGKTLQILEGHTGNITSIAVQNGKIFTASVDGTVRHWNINLPYQKIVELCEKTDCSDSQWDTTLSGATQKSPKLSFRKKAVSTAISPNGDYTAVGFEDGTIHLYSLINGQFLSELKAHTECKRVKNPDEECKSHVRSLSFNKEGNLLASASYDKTFKLWKIENNTLQLVKDFPIQNGKLYSIAFSPSPNNQKLAVASLDGKVSLFDIESGKLEQSLEYKNRALSVDFDKTGTQLLSAGDNQVRLANINKLSNFRNLEIGKENDAILRAVFSPDNKKIAVVGQGSLVTLYDIDNQEQFSLSGHKNTIYDAIFTPDGQLIATISSDWV